MNLTVLDFSEKYKEKLRWRVLKLNDLATNYSVSSHGNVRNNKSMIILKTFKNTQGYETVKLSINGKDKTFRVNRLVLMVFHPLSDIDSLISNHINEDKSDNRWVNLNWMTPGENTKYSMKKIEYIEEDKVIIICEMLEKGVDKITIANLVQVNVMSVIQIYYRYRWKNISKNYTFTYRSNIGSANSNSKHTEDQIHEVCCLLVEGRSTKYIHKNTGVSKKSIHDVYKRRKWNHISKYYTFDGKTRGNSKYSTDQIHSVCKLLSDNEMSQAEISRLLGVSKPMVNLIKSRSNWTHISKNYDF